MPSVCSHRSAHGDSETAGLHGQSLPLLSGPPTLGKEPTGPQAFTCAGLRLEMPGRWP